MEALRPTYPTKSNNPSDPDNIRKFLFGDANELKSVAENHADLIDTLMAALGLNEGTNSIGSFVSLGVLQAAYPDGAAGSYAIIDDGLGSTPAVATYNELTEIWELADPPEELVWVADQGSLPGTGVANRLYVALDSGAMYYWNSGEWKGAGSQGAVPIVRYIENNGVQYKTEKAFGKSGSAFEIDDIVEGWYDSNKQRWIRCVVLTPPLTLPGDFDSNKVFKITDLINI